MRWMSPWVMVLFLAACGGGSDAPPGNGDPGPTPPPPPPPPPPPAEAEFKVALSDFPPGNGGLGSVFEFVSADGSARCGAGFISATGTRVYFNQNDLEFWCDGPDPAPLAWEVIPRPPDSGVPSIMLGSFAGALYEHTGRAWLDFAIGEWQGSILPGQPPSDGDLVAIRDDARRWSLTTSRDGCEGLSVFSTDGYHGTLPADSTIAAATVWRGHVYANWDSKVWRAEVPSSPASTGCQMLTADLLLDEPLYSYMMLPVGDDLWIGGGGQPFIDDRRHECAPMYVTDGTQVEIVELQGCVFPRITETYSLMTMDDALYVGTYAEGQLYRIDLDAREATQSAMPAFPSDVYEQGGVRYLETQSMTIARGRPLIGVFPWGEIYELGAEQRVYRLFSGPEKIPGAMRPFADDDDTRDWSQRVTSLVTGDGRVCAGTGNTFREPYDAAAFPFLTPSLAAEYGQAWCAPLPNQTLASGFPQPGEYTFRVTETHLVIERDGVAIASRAHDLPTATVEALAADGGGLTLGAGRYGRPFATITGD